MDLLVSCSDDRKVIETFERSLLTPRDCQLAAYHLHKLAIVYFMQLYVDGDDDPGKVAANKGLAEMERSRLEALAFTDVNDLKKFRQLVLQLHVFSFLCHVTHR